MASLHIDIVRTAVHGVIMTHLPHDSTIWTALRKSAIRRNVRDFLLKMVNHERNISRYWAHTLGYEDRAQCPIFPGGQTETMAHILMECQAPVRSEIWALCHRL